MVLYHCCFLKSTFPTQFLNKKTVVLYNMLCFIPEICAVWRVKISPVFAFSTNLVKPVRQGKGAFPAQRRLLKKSLSLRDSAHTVVAIPRIFRLPDRNSGSKRSIGGLPHQSEDWFAATCFLNRSLSSRQTKKQNVFSRISEMRSWFSFMQLPASCGNPLVQGSLADADAADSCSNE